MTDYGRAAAYDFDNPNKWVTVADVPLLDEHTMTGDDGQPMAEVNKAALEQIAYNNNRKVRETGDPATLILGHTSDDPRAEEKPAQGFVVNYRVKPFKRNQDGQIIYAIHGDYKLRPNKAHLVEEYPRRSVELWWHKKDIDPIAMLGGSSPERDLGVVLRKSRNAILMNHVSLGTASASAVGSVSGVDSSYEDEGVIKFCRRGSYSIETYTISDPIPTHKYSKRRGSSKVATNGAEMNNGNGKPKRNSAASNAHIPAERRPSKYSEHQDGDGMEYTNKFRERRPNKYAEEENETPIGASPVRRNPKQPLDVEEMHDGPDEMDEGMHGGEHSVNLNDEPDRYDSLDQDMDGHGTEDFDGGAEAIPGENEDQDESDPVLAKVFQSKQWNEAMSGIDQIKQMLQGMMGGGQEESGMDGPGDGDGMGGEEMPQPGASQAPPVGADGGMGMDGGGDEEQEPQEEDQRSMHGSKPVKMGAAEGTPHSTGMPGPSSGYVPTFAKGKKPPSKMSRGENMNRTQQRSPISDLQARLARSEKREREMRKQLSRMKAQADIQQLENEGILFGPTPEVADKIKYQRMEELTLAYLHDEDSAETGEPDTYVQERIDEMRQCYSRRRADPARRNAPNVASVARYSRTEADVAGEKPTEASDDDFEDKLGTIGSFEAINEFANISAKQNRQEAIKFCRKKYGIR